MPQVGVSGGDGGIVLLEMSDIDFGASFENAMAAKTRKKVSMMVWALKLLWCSTQVKTSFFFVELDQFTF